MISFEDSTWKILTYVVAKECGGKFRTGTFAVALCNVEDIAHVIGGKQGVEVAFP